MIRMKTLMSATALLLGLAACGITTQDRALSGGALGAGIGAGIGAVTHGDIVTDAVLGGAAGAIGGAVTSPRDINLGRPVWREDDPGRPEWRDRGDWRYRRDWDRS
jgi:hypothetical protein